MKIVKLIFKIYKKNKNKKYKFFKKVKVHTDLIVRHNKYFKEIKTLKKLLY
jgi:hypothetical protein